MLRTPSTNRRRQVQAVGHLAAEWAPVPISKQQPNERGDGCAARAFLLKASPAASAEDGVLGARSSRVCSAFLASDRGVRSDRRPRSGGLAALPWRFRSASSTLERGGRLALSVFTCSCKSCFRGVWEQFTARRITFC